MADNLTNPESVSTSAGHRDGVSLLPWQVRYVDVVADATGAKVAACFRHANAALIVEAVNNYHPLIQERRRLIGELDAAKVHADSEECWADEYFEAKAAAEAEARRLRDLVRRLARVAQDTLDFAEAMASIILDHPERAKARSEIKSLLREAREALE